MAGLLSTGGILLAQLFDGIVQTEANEVVGFTIKARIFLADEGYNVGEIKVFHMKRRWTVAHAKPSRNLALTSFTRSRLGQRSEKRILVIEPMQDANQPKISPQTLRDFPLAGASLAGKDASSLKRTSAKLTAEGLRITRPRIAILTAPLAPPILSIARPYLGPRRRRESSDDRALALLYSVRSRARGEKTAW